MQSKIVGGTASKCPRSRSRTIGLRHGSGSRSRVDRLSTFRTIRHGTAEHIAMTQVERDNPGQDTETRRPHPLACFVSRRPTFQPSHARTREKGGEAPGIQIEFGFGERCEEIRTDAATAPTHHGTAKAWRRNGIMTA